jgi:hypothetical protein
MWAVSLARRISHHGDDSVAGMEYIAVDGYAFDHPTIVRFLRRQDYIPVLSHEDGSPATIDAPVDIIKHCIVVLNEQGSGCQLDDGIKARLFLLVGRLSIGHD